MSITSLPSMENLLYETVSDYYFVEFPLWANPHYMKIKLLETRTTIPIAVARRLDLYKVLTNLIHEIIIGNLFVQSIHWSKSNGVSKSYLWTKLTSCLQDISSIWFKGFHFLRSFCEEGVCITARPENVVSEVPLTLWEKEYLPSGKTSWKFQISLPELQVKMRISRTHFHIRINDENFLLPRGYLVLISDLISQRFVLSAAVMLAAFAKKN